mgnify:CR=1 FL=1
MNGKYLGYVIKHHSHKLKGAGVIMLASLVAKYIRDRNYVPHL